MVNQKCIEKLEEYGNKESLEYRALHMINSINLALKVNQEIAIDPNQPAKERLEAAQLIVDQQINLIRLLKEGPEFIRSTLEEPTSQYA